MNQPRLAIFVGASPGGFPNADLSWVEVTESPISGTSLSLSPNNLVFNAILGGDPSPQTVNVFLNTTYTFNWDLSSDASWLSIAPVTGTTPGRFSVAVNATGLTAGVYTGTITVTSPLADNSPQAVKVTLTVNPYVSVAPWKGGKRGALSISVDDGESSCFDELTRNGFKGTYFTNGTTPPSFYSSYYLAGMELGSHLTNHLCINEDISTFSAVEIIPSIQGICTAHRNPVKMSFRWHGPADTPMCKNSLFPLNIF